MTPREWYDEARRIRRDFLAEIEQVCENQIAGVSGESDTVSDGPGSLLTPRGRGRSSSGVRR